MTHHFLSCSGFVFVLFYRLIIWTKDGKISVREVVHVSDSVLKRLEDVITTDQAFNYEECVVEFTGKVQESCRFRFFTLFDVSYLF